MLVLVTYLGSAVVPTGLECAYCLHLLAESATIQKYKLIFIEISISSPPITWDVKHTGEPWYIGTSLPNPSGKTGVVVCVYKMLYKNNVVYRYVFDCLVSLVVLSATATLEVLGSNPRSSKCYWVFL